MVAILSFALLTSAIVAQPGYIEKIFVARAQGPSALSLDIFPYNNAVYASGGWAQYQSQSFWAIASGGTPPYNYSWGNAAGIASVSSPIALSNAAANQYVNSTEARAGVWVSYVFVPPSTGPWCIACDIADSGGNSASNYTMCDAVPIPNLGLVIPDIVHPDIFLWNNTPAAGVTDSLSALVVNTGLTTVTGATVSFYNNSYASLSASNPYGPGWTLIGTSTPFNITAGAKVVCSWVSWVPTIPAFGYGNGVIYPTTTCILAVINPPNTQPQRAIGRYIVDENVAVLSMVATPLMMTIPFLVWAPEYNQTYEGNEVQNR